MRALCAAAALVALGAAPAAGAAIRVVQTARDLPDRLAPKADLRFGGDFAGANFTVSVRRQDRRQTILGFGGAFTDAAAENFAALTPAQQDELVAAYWGPGGLGYTVGRIPINSCDFTVDTYSFDEVPGDLALAQFDTNVTRDTLKMIPLVRRALAAAGGLRLYGSPWSPPSWMKIPHPGQPGQGMNGSADPNGLIQDPAVQDAWANYFVKWIAAYERHGVPIWGVTVQNEPQARQPFESCLYTAEAERDFVKLHLGPALRRAYPQVKLMVWDHNKYNCTLKPKGCPDAEHDRDMLRRAEVIFGDPAAAQYIDGVAFHWYQIFEGYDWGFDVLAATGRAAGPGKFVLNTEACVCPVAPTWDHGELYGTDILGDLNAGSVGWVDWNLLLDSEGGPNHIPGHRCEAPVMRGPTNGTAGAPPLAYLAQFYYMGHVSKFVLPGATVVGTTVSPPPATRLTDKNVPVPFVSAVATDGADGNTTVVLLNTQDAEVTIRLAEDGGRFARVAMPARSVVTLVYPTAA